MIEIIYLLLASANIPFMLDKKNKHRVFSGIAFGFNIGFLVAHIINKI